MAASGPSEVGGGDSNCSGAPAFVTRVVMSVSLLLLSVLDAYRFLASGSVMLPAGGAKWTNLKTCTAEHYIAESAIN